MSSITAYFVLPFVRDADDGLTCLEAEESASGAAATVLAGEIVGKARRGATVVGAITIAHTIRPDLPGIDVMAFLDRYGETPNGWSEISQARQARQVWSA